MCTSLWDGFAGVAGQSVKKFNPCTFDLFKFRKCNKGLSGGMSVIGTLSALLSCVLIGLITLFISGGTFGWFEVLISAGCAFLGVIFDSLLGSVFHVKFCST